ncbi:MULTISPECIES: bifunctional adenosylcobinamide kinase/adenosylcobinamide-phosphate guanylyltransferase [Sphingobium]|uniref:Bifunctional adenosylcobalamin biosynthesis protein n=2 Tax=Sphingobium cupriresistens TaxID=1132417 RepID=A0A0J7XKG2_9SPHN|nr:MULTISPECIES: bifunctional adenosylcobinamide kinase/adenosylcobinamide-phosphate guanylyltransferase [Sphingobium]KMS52177.1 adenosylcobinamide kinase [Sphingobium cupriresistens LL01]MBJ7375981.1 bifunctional adenosylcobinamide kinase/adenosylcobinamide-phosphate guanylyltransferase [Sphingobium sp.]RYM09957.1 bifunctional adenosylcobinamide kinase/adenosylcobinamide-phosphate guanylyltransferase [Sphingobium cupriresistens]WCP15553.1 Bifunctional adenosylcobalamin biosynthesis protein Cob
MTILLVLGGARSGKSRYALARAEAMSGDCLFVATAQALDSEMDSRITRHRAERGDRWRTIEEPIALAAIVQRESRPERILLIDCLTLWASNLMMAERDIDEAVAAFVAALRQARGQVILVANEVGLGIVPDNVLARRFRDVAGTINQAVAACSDEAMFLAAGLPMRLR